jgi:ribosome biogenesis GTPase A
MQAIATRRGMLLQGGEVDLERSSTTLIRDFRDGKLGRFTFERPDERKAVVVDAQQEDTASDDDPPEES